MVGLPIVIAVAVGCSAFLIVGAILGVVVWWRMRQDRLSLAMAHARQTITHQGPVCSSLVTESPIESPLPTYPYPYLRHDYMPIGSQETIQPWPSQAKKSPPPTLKKEKSKSIRRSISKSLSKSLSIGKNNKKPLQQEPMPVSPLDETFLPPFPNAKEKEPKSAIAGFSELPTEITPRNTPERERDDVIPLETLNGRPNSTAWPLLQQDRISFVSGGQATIFDRYPSKLRSGSITAQTAGTVPEMPMPPLPVGLGQPYQLSHEDSLMGMSSLSLETANSSILDEGLRRSMSVDGEHNHSPSLPPCPTFTPFSPYDIVIGGSVARNCASQRRSQSQRLSSSTARLTYMSAESSKGDLDDRISPRRSLTTREVSPQPSGWAASELPRRSETVNSSSSAGRPNSRPASSISASSPGGRYSATGQGIYSRQEFGTQSNLKERYSMYETSQTKEENNAAFSKSVGDRPRSIQAQSPKATRDSPGRAPLPSAMKSAQNMRKGHRRQNCVRISIHPPITFSGPAFSPMPEEPEEVLDLEKDLGILKSQQQSNQLSVRRTESKYQPKHARHRSTGSIPEEPVILTDSPGTNSRIPRPSSSNKKRRHSRTSSADDFFMSENRVIIPDRCPGPVPEEEGHSLSSTPSPEKHEPLWSLPHSDAFVGCSPILPTNASTGSPRRPAPKGPRIQPIRSQRNTVPYPSTSQPIPNGVYTFTAGTSSREGSPTSKVGRSHTLAASPTKDVRKSITLLRRMNSEAWDDESKQYRRMGRNASLKKPRINKFSTPPQSNRNSIMSNDSLTIWEDSSEDDASIPPPVRRKNHPFKILERIDSEGTAEESMSNADAQRQQTIRQVPLSSSIVTFGDNEHRVKTNSDNNTDELVHKSAERASVISTPKTKAHGYGIMSLTPGSLYDGDGFLKE